MRVVLDTNVLISGTFWTGDSFRIVQLIDKGELTLILSKEILDEYDYILHSDEITEKKAYKPECVASILKQVQLANFIEPIEKLKVVENDPDDDKFIEAAIAGNADYIISQDNHLLKLKEFRGIKIVTPAEFLNSLNVHHT